MKAHASMGKTRGLTSWEKRRLWDWGGYWFTVRCHSLSVLSVWDPWKNGIGDMSPEMPPRWQSSSSLMRWTYTPLYVNLNQLVYNMDFNGLHCGFSEYLTRFECKQSPSSKCDTDLEDNVPHILTECPVFSKMKYDTRQALNVKIVVRDLHSTMKYNQRNRFLSYCTEIVKIVNKRNKTN